MPKKKLTDYTVKNIKVKTGQVDFFDKAFPGFALRVTAKGKKSWVIFYRLGGKVCRYTIGKYPALGLKDARKAAGNALELVDEGKHPKDVRDDKKKAERQPDTFATVADEFIERYAKKNNRSWKETERVFKEYVKKSWGNRPIDTITRRDAIELLDGVMDKNGPYMANRVLATVRKLFNWCLERGILVSTPVANMKAPGKEVERERVLSDNEITCVWQACDEKGWPWGPFGKMLMVTAQRRNEVAHMRWDDIKTVRDEEKDVEYKVWTLPREITKSNRVHEVPLSPLATEIITGLKHVDEYVFAGRKLGRPLAGFSRAKASIDKISGVKGWRLHDLRRTAGTNMAQLGVSISTISRVLNHKEGGVTKIYARYSYLDEKHRALYLWSQKLESLVRPAEGDNVVPMVSSE